jgi:hypothetical protein
MCAALLFWPSICWAQASNVDKQSSMYDRIWEFAEWYKNEKNHVIQNVLFSGRFQYEYENVNANQGSHHEWNVRRLRLGAKTQWFRQLTLHGEVELNPQETSPFYVRLTDMYLQWSKSGQLKLQSALQFADMNDRAKDGGVYSGVSFTTGLRVSR